MARTDRYQWRYLIEGHVAHALVDPADTTAVCGVGPLLAFYWRGTGSQTEYDRVAELPECKHCVKRAPGAIA